MASSLLFAIALEVLAGTKRQNSKKLANYTDWKERNKAAIFTDAMMMGIENPKSSQVNY